MQQLSLFLDNVDPRAMLIGALKRDDDADLFGFDATEEKPELADEVLVPSLGKDDDEANDVFVAVEAQTQPDTEVHLDEESVTITPAPSARVRQDQVSRSGPPWPLLLDSDISCVQGQVSKFEANVAAIRLLHSLQSESREPSAQERIVLQRYTGWGGLKAAIQGDPGWAERRDVLRNLLTEDEFRTARDSVLNAHYTEIPVVESVWKAVQHFGFTGGRILDPSAGAGHFFGAMPPEIAMVSDLHAVEIDSMSAQIHRALYGHACRLEERGFEKVDYPKGWFDLVISNVPFGNYPVPCQARKPYSRWSIHHYFLGKALDVVRPGGLVAIITSTYTMDSADEKRRAWFHSQAELIGALRLPAGAFKRIANTEVVADVLFFRRRETTEVARPDERAFEALVEVPADIVEGNLASSQRRANEYWLAHPECVLGKWVSSFNGRNRFDLQVQPSDQDHLPTKLQLAIESLPSAFYKEADEQGGEYHGVKVATDAAYTKQGAYVCQHGEIYQCDLGELKLVDSTGQKAKRIRGLVEIRDTVRQLLAMQMDPNAEDQAIDRLRASLNRLYDGFVKRHGWIFSRGNSLAFREDPDWPLLLALEHYDEETDVATKAEIFNSRTTRPVAAPTSADSAEDAVQISMAEYGHLNVGYVAQLLKVPEENALQQLADGGLAFINPETGYWESREEYLTGNVRKKLAVAEMAGMQYAKNAVALQSVLPQDVLPGDIDARLGVAWVTCSEYLEFIGHLAGEDAMRYAPTMEVTRDSTTGSWAVINRMIDTSFNTKWGTKDITALDLFVDSMNGRKATCRDAVYKDDHVIYVVNVEKTAAARERQAKMDEEFCNWLWRDPDRSQRLVRRYNDEHNAYVERKYDGSRLRLEGYSWYLAPSPHQLNAIARIMTGNNVLLGHVVGAGKTLEMVAGSMELRRLGLRKKILHVVPNHMLDQTASEFLRAYPAARVLIARKADLHKERRKQFVARVATGDWDAVIMTHSTFERIPADAVVAKRLMEEMLAEVSAALEAAKRNREDRIQVKMLVKMEKLWKAKLESAAAEWKKDDFISLATLGVDQVTYDEAHLAKNLVRITQMDRVSGLPNTDSQRAFDLFVKTRQMLAVHGDKERGVVLATGTFVANSMAELHVMQRFLQPLTLKAHGLDSFDAWAAQFGRVVTSLEVSPDGSSFRMNERFAQFVNMPELMRMFRQVADIQTKEMLKLPTPPLATGAPQTVVCKPSDELKEFIAELVKRAERIRNREVKPNEDNMLSVTTDGRMAALDLRLVKPGAKEDPNGKVATCVRTVHRLWLESQDFRGAQMIFCDAGTPGSTSLDVYAAIRTGLIRAGVPADEIAFIHDAKTDIAKAHLFRNVREGRVRVLLASTQKGGVGTNVQTRLYAVHQLDVPWRPCDVEQRDGRIERRGNMCESIHLLRYVTEGSFDAYSWQTLCSKLNFISQVMSGETTARRVEDASLTALSYEEVKAIACGNPAVKEKAQLDNEMRRLEMLQSHHRSSVASARWEIQSLEANLVSQGATRAAILDDQAISAQAGEVLVTKGATFNGPSESCFEYLTKINAALSESPPAKDVKVRIGKFAGLELCAVASRAHLGRDYAFLLGEHYRQEVFAYESGANLYRALVKALQDRAEDLKKLEQRISNCERAIPQLRLEAASKFDKLERMAEIRARIAQLEVELGLHKNGEGTEAMDEKSELKNLTTLSGSDAEMVVEPETVEA